MGLEVMQKRTSDLLSMCVGPRNIGNAFEEAPDDNAFLVFDEGESASRESPGGARVEWNVGMGYGVSELVDLCDIVHDCRELPARLHAT